MFIIFNNLIKFEFKKALYNTLFQLISGGFNYFIFKKIYSIGLKETEIIGISFFLIPSIFLSAYLLLQKRVEPTRSAPSLQDEHGNTVYAVPSRLEKLGLGPLWVNVIQGGSDPTFGFISFGVSFIIAPLYLLSILYLYINNYNELTSFLFRPFGILSIGIFAIQSRIILADYINAGHYGKSLDWFKRLKMKCERELFILIDLVFILFVLVLQLTGNTEVLKYILFFYGFRLIRIVLLIPYFEDIWDSISRGIRLSANYVISFLVILFVLSISSRVLFSEKNENFKSLLSSVYTNFQIVLGNGFELAANSQEVLLYVFLVTILIGIIFTSAITALITDSLLEKSKGQESNEAKLKWYKRDVDELKIVFYIRLLIHISRT
jgi:hypothetical protein